MKKKERGESRKYEEKEEDKLEKKLDKAKKQKNTVLKHIKADSKEFKGQLKDDVKLKKMLLRGK